MHKLLVRTQKHQTDADVVVIDFPVRTTDFDFALAVLLDVPVLTLWTLERFKRVAVQFRVKPHTSGRSWVGWW